ncbi:MAG: AraC family transcriptional regulator [Coriobacteriales bacterium]|jgi:AraC-like DNA-binding protein|nr:AraC family transcriptional regulator [Coriobacteriales bacterium]
MANNPFAHLRSNKTVTGFRSRWKWYFSGALVISITLILLAYMGFVQACAAFADGGGSIAGFERDLLVRLLKCLILVLTFGLFWFFFSIQDYQTTFARLLERLSTTEGAEATEAAEESPEALKRTDARGAPPSQTDELTLITTSVDTMLQVNRDFAAQLSSQQKLLVDNLIIRLMKGWVQDGPLAFEMCRSLRLDFGSRPLQVLVFGLDENPQAATLSDETLFSSSQLLQQTLPQMFRGLFEGHTVEIEGMVACLCLPLSDESLSDQQTASDLISIVKLTQDMVIEETGIFYRAALGSIYQGLSGVKQSFSEAIEMLQYSNLLGLSSRVSQYWKTKPQTQEEDRISQAWARQEMQLMNCIDSEDFAQAGVILAHMFESEYLRCAPTFELAQFRLLNLTNTMITMLGKIRLWVGGGLSDYTILREKILFSRRLPELRVTANELFDILNNQQFAKHQQSGYALTMNVVDYISSNYSDPNLSVSQLASHFERNPSYLSRTFKRLMETGLADYIQHVRVKEAKRLMLDRTISVRDAATQVGFSTVTTMNRAFRKHEGTTAGRLRGHYSENE